MLCARTDAIREVPADRWSIAAHFDASPGRAGKSYSKWGGFIDHIGRFDSSFFGISPREADAMDPQQRLLLEATWEAFEDAGLKWDHVRGSRTGVFVGISTSDYANLQYQSGGQNVADVYSAPGCAFSIAANRISYCLDLRGPSLAIDTACSSALSACHVACQTLWRGDCETAVVAGVNALLNQNSFVAFSRMSMLSPDGRCKAFDAGANGFVRSEGVGAVIVKPLGAAHKADDRIYAVIRATAANQDGRTNGITVPSQQAQEELIRGACQSAGIAPADIGYVEAHGTGTAIGDPIETAALGAALGDGRTAPCLIGSVKTNIGHLEAASGIASLIKVALVLKHRQIPPNLHFRTPNPHIDFEGLKLRVVDQMQAFPERDGALLAGINSFGFGGANAHVILEAAPARNGRLAAPPPVPGRLVLPPAAHSPEALRQAAANYSELLSKDDCDARALCGAAATRRSGFAHRLCAVAASRRELSACLTGFAAGEASPAIVSGETIASAGPVFVFSGQGTQWWAMGRELLQTQPVFRAAIEQCDAIFRELGSWSLIEELKRSEQDSRLHTTAIAQPAIFALQAALAGLWNSWGVEPVAVVGHSVGEAAAAYVAGALTLPEAARVIFHRGRTMNAASNKGRMLAASLSPAQAEELVAPYGGEVEVGACNSPVSVTLSGEPAPLERIAKELDARGVFNRFLKVNYAFHSHQMDAVKEDLLESLGHVEVSAPRIPLYSTVSGALFQEGDFNEEYWWCNVRRPVRFSDAISSLSTQGHKLFLELSAHPALIVSISETLAARAAEGKAFFSLRRKEPEADTMLRSLGALYAAGASVDWTKLYPGSFAHVSLPVYPWQHANHWRETRSAHSARLDSSNHFFLNSKMDAAGPVWKAALDTGATPWLREHRVLDHVLFPGAAFIEAALEAGVDLFGALPVEVADIEFKEALVLPESKETVELQTAYSAVDSSLRLSGRRQEENADWTLNATAKVRPHGGAAAATVDIERLKKSLADSLDQEQIYAVCRQHGFDYGPPFRGLQHVWRNDKEALGRIELPEELAGGAGRFQVHPAFLDACIQTVFFAAPLTGSRQTFVPVGVDRLVLLDRPARTAYCHAILAQTSQRSAAWNLRICDETGNVLIVVEGMRTQTVRGAGKAKANDPAEWLYDTKWIEKPLASDSAQPQRNIAGRWLVFADRSGVAEALATKLRANGAEPHLLAAESYVVLGEDGKTQLSPRLVADLRAILAPTGSSEAPALAGAIHLWSLDAAPSEDLDGPLFEQAQALTCHSLLEMVQTLANQHGTPPVWIVTRGAQTVAPGEPVAVAQSPAIGMGRTMSAEHPRMDVRLVDLGNGESELLAGRLWQEIVAGDGETEVAWRVDLRRVNRIAHRAMDSLVARPQPGRSMGHSLLMPSTGVMDELAWCEVPRRRPAAQEIEIEIEAAAINFRDILKSLGLYPIERDRDLLLGDECSGRVTAVGSKVTAFKPGDEVIATGAGCFSSHIAIPASCAIRKPAKLSFEAAAAFPVAFMTAWYALHRMGRIQRGESVLIHSAAGGVGLAAMQIAKLTDAEIYATAGSEEKRRYLRKLGARQVFDSRSTAFAAEVRRATKGRGVDLVLNSLAGDAIAKGLSALAPGGRFLEIGKRDVYANTAIGLRHLRDNVSMHVIDLGRILAEAPGQVQELLNSLMKLFRSGALRPLPHTVLPFSQATEAFRQMAQARHIGKIVLTAKNDRIVPRRRLPQDPVRFPAAATYLITGGLGGFGLAVARRMVSNGARNLVLASRSGAATPEVERAVAELRREGAHVRLAKVDVSDERQVAKLMRTIAAGKTPLRGIFHLAMVLDDGILAQLTPARIARVMAPKAAGAWNLHRASLNFKLDHFVLFSSVASLLGTPGQANYVAANCFLDTLAHYRRALGLPAIAINWGAIEDIGVLARNQGVADHLAAHGVEGIAPADATEMLGHLLQSDSAQIGFAQILWQKMTAARAPRFSEVIAASGAAGTEDGRDFRSLIQSAPPAERLAAAASLICETVAAIIRTQTAKIDLARPLNEMGLDSLMAFELINRLEDSFAISLPTGAISANSTVNSLAAIVLESYGMSDAAAPAAEKGAAVSRDAAGQAILLRPGDADRPLFFIHPVGGGTEIFAELAALLPRGLQAYGIQSRMLAGQRDECGTLDELARSYAGIVVGLQPRGPIRIAGFSAGSIFAVATASELERRGRIVSFIGAIEAPFSALDPGCPRETVIKNMIVEIFDWMGGEKAGAQANAAKTLDWSALELARRLVAASSEDEKLSMIHDWLIAQGVDLDGNKSGPSNRQEIFRRIVRHTVLLDEVRIEAPNAPVWSWQADKSLLTVEGVSGGASQRVTRGALTHNVIGGRHFEVMTPPRVGVLAEQFAAALAQSEDRGTAAPTA
jgi:acyl transferase domain-containing protein/NADPH:quinone reductase-like Zn-dependent oxidoreductase/thioesterase domain-containing protein/NAD(P)-dependent dehydrogenase (short-subunit alcohol dehydrogenase family)